MTSILVVDDDEMFRGWVAQELASHGYGVVQAGGVEEAVQELRRQPPEVMLTDLRMGDQRDGVDLLGASREVAPQTLTILMSGFATAQDYQRAIDLGAVRVLTKPFTPKEMLGAIEHAQACGTGFRGSVHGLSLIDLLQMFHFARRTIELQIAGTEPATLEFRDGEIVHARRGELSGVPAFQAIVQTPSGAVSTGVPARQGPQTVDVPFQVLLMDALRELDELSTSPAPEGNAAAVTQEDRDAFADWVSIPPAARPAEGDERLLAVGGALERTAPNFGAGILEDGASSLQPLRGMPPNLYWPALIADLHAFACQVAGGEGVWQLELMGPDVGFAQLRPRGQRCTVVLEAVLRDRLAAQRFRSQVCQVWACLPGAMQAGDPEGT